MQCCDFCMSPRPAWCYPAQSFIDAVGSESQGDWLACHDCHRLIESHDHGGLGERALRNVTPPASPREAAWSRWYVADLHEKFRESRTGPAWRLAS